MWETIILIVSWFKSLFSGPKGVTQIGKGNKATSQSSTGDNSPVVAAGRDVHVNMMPVDISKETIDIYVELEEIMGELIGELREEIKDDPFIRDIIVLNKKSIPYGWQSKHLLFSEDEQPGIRDKIKVLVNQGLLKEIKDDFAYRISENFVRYLKKPCP